MKPLTYATEKRSELKSLTYCCTGSAFEFVKWIEICFDRVDIAWQMCITHGAYLFYFFEECM
jgi:hypothetical protein